MKPTIKVRTVTDGSVKASKSFADVQRMKVYVGVPEASSVRKEPTITNSALTYILTHGVRSIAARTQVGAAMINHKIDFEAATKMYLHSHGSMSFAVPPRPIIEPAIEANTSQLLPDLRDAAVAQLSGNKTGVSRSLNRAGLIGQNLARGWFTDPRNHWAPNAPSTIKRKGSAQPNIDTGELRKSITYVVSEK